MIEIPRSLVRRFRGLLRHCGSPLDRQRELPVIVCHAGPAGLALEAVRTEVAVRYQLDGPRVGQRLSVHRVSDDEVLGAVAGLAPAFAAGMS